MDETRNSTMNRGKNVTRIAFWGTLTQASILLLMSTAVAAMTYSGMASGQTTDGTNILNVVTAAITLSAVLNLASIVFTVRGRQDIGFSLTYASLVLFLLNFVFVVQGRALFLSFFFLLPATLGIGWLCPPHSRRLYGIVTAITFALAWVIEWVNPAWRISYSGTQLGPAIALVFAIIFGIMLYFQSREAIASNLRLKIVVWTGVIIFTLSVILVFYSVNGSRQAAITAAQDEALAVSEAHAGNVKSQIDPALNAARTLAYSLGIVKDPINPAPLTRDQANAMLRKVAEENPSFLGTWTLWEPNAFDGQDMQYANTPLHDSTGRFIPYWVRVNNKVEGVAIVDYETPGIGDFYLIPRETKQESILTPYLYPIDGVNVLITSLAVPIVENNHFYGVAGVDYRMDFVQGIVDEINLYDGTATSVLVTDAGTLIAVRNQPDMTLQPATSIFEDFDQIQPRIASGDTFVSISPDGQYLRVFSPIDVGVTGSHWSFSLIIPFSVITAEATNAAVQGAIISSGLILLAIIILWYLAGQIVRPIQNLTATANAISQGDLNATADVQAVDETGILANTFNAMTSRLREILSTLEQRVADRTRNLELAAEVGRSVSQVRDLDVMLKDACNLILKEFNLYYVQVYLADASASTLRLEAGTGSVGAQLVGRGHSLPLNISSINGRAAVEKRPVVISDTAQSTTFRQNPLLPETRGEMAIPLIVADKVVGVLDMQSSEAGALSNEILPAFEALAGQLAVAVQNANLLAETEQARAEVEKQARQLVRTGWNEHLDAIHKPEQIGFVFDHKEVRPLIESPESQIDQNANLISSSISITGERLGSLAVEMNEGSVTDQAAELVSLVAQQVARQIENLRLLENAERYRYEAEQAARLQTIEGWQKYVASRPTEGMAYLYDTREVQPHDTTEDNGMFALPLKARDEMIGKLAVQGLTDQDEESAAIASAVAERLSAHIENLRLFEETRMGQLELDKRARQLAAVAEVSSVSSRELDIQKMLQSVVHLTQRKFGLYHAHVFIYNEQTNMLEISACGWKDGDEHEGTHGTTAISIAQEQSLVARAARTQQAVIVNDVRNEPGWLPNPLLPDSASELAVPLIIGEKVLGVLDVQSDQMDVFTSEDANIYSTLASQIATALQNAQSFTQAQLQAERESRLNVISQKIQSATTVEAVLQIAARELGHTLGAPLTIAQLGLKESASGN